jgi:NADPH:quinone reductase-like Zn-dependent oxidoreductase
MLGKQQQVVQSQANQIAYLKSNAVSTGIDLQERNKLLQEQLLAQAHESTILRSQVDVISNHSDGSTLTMSSNKVEKEGGLNTVVYSANTNKLSIPSPQEIG